MQVKYINSKFFFIQIIQNMLGINWMHTNQVHFIWLDSIKMKVSPYTYLTKSGGNCNCLKSAFWE